MRYRCGNKNASRYKNYGGRGIKVCPEWRKDFVVFMDWALNNGYKKGLSIDRIDNDGNYEPSNCRWATVKQQNRNARFNRHIAINGVTKSLCEWAEVAGISRKTLQWRVNNGWHPGCLLNKPKAA